MNCRCLLLAALLAVCTTGAQAFAQTAPAGAPGLVERVWYDGDRARRVWMADDEIALVFDASAMARRPAERERDVAAAVPGSVLVERQGRTAYFRLPPGAHAAERARALRGRPGVGHASAAFYEHPARRGRLALNGEIIVGLRTPLDPPALTTLASRFGLRLLSAVGASPNTYLFDAQAADDSLALANEVRRLPEVAFAYPNWVRTLVPR